MADIEAARAEIQKVVAQLVNRFGHESEVFEHLSRALGHLSERRVSRQAVADLIPPAPPEEATATAEPFDVTDSTAATIEVEAPAPPLEEPPAVAKAVPRMGAHRQRR